ncbi:hypothetical protein [Ralstonia sp. ASV6]|uniref:hypothetical protein n=1 Tax=Ralstonia sp. ASV6 TaxID=2795124 RepID=UPI0018EE3517|nr:hypothetical protein [Ralstonia sp. ASV6]
MAVRLPLFAVQAVLVAVAARYTLIGWNHFGLTLLMSASMTFSFGWVFIATERYLLIALTEGATRIAGLSAFLLIPSNSADAALFWLAASGAAQSLVQLFAARQLGLLRAISAPKLRRLRLHTRHFAAYRSALAQAVGRNILPVAVGALVTPSIASAALAAEKVSRAATGIVSAVLGYVLPALGRGFRERPVTQIYGLNLLITLIVGGVTAAALMVYVRASHASLAQLFSGSTMLLVVAALLTGARVVFSATLYMRVLAPGKFALASHLLALQTVGAICASLLLRSTSSVVLFLLTLCALDLTLTAAASRIGRRDSGHHQKRI